MTNPKVSVITLTHARPDYLLRALRSVAAQIDVQVQPVVIGDDARYLDDPEYRAKLEEIHPDVVIENVRRTEATRDEYPQARLGRLRNTGIALAAGEFIAHLDDDNTFESDHLKSLLAALDAAPGTQVAYSWRRLLRPDATPFVPDGEDPWCLESEDRAGSYRELRDLGVFVPDSNVVRDANVVGDRVLARVDTCEYLVHREIHRRFRFPEKFPRAWRERELGEDIGFSWQLIRARVPIVCTGKATLNYTVGGMSNGH